MPKSLAGIRVFRSVPIRCLCAHAVYPLLIIIMFGFLAMQAGAQPAETTPEKAIVVDPEAKDPQIANRLQRILESTNWFKQPRASVRDGVVTLEGKTATIEHQRWAGELAEKTEGAVAVINRIDIEADVNSTFGRAQDEFRRLASQIIQSWPILLLAGVILAASALIAKLVALLSRRFFAPRIASPLLLSVVARAFSIPIFLLGVYFVLQAAGLTGLALTVLGGTGLAGVIVGFAFRDIAENFLASVLLSMRNPFQSGDLIEVAGQTGVVQSMNTRSSVLLTLDGNHVQIPNATVYKSTIRNFSSTPNRRADFTIGIGYDSSTAKAQLVIAEVLKSHPAVLPTPEPLVLVNDLGAATVNLKILYWFDSKTFAPDKINSALLRLAKNALLQSHIELPDAAREVVFPKGVPIRRQQSTDASTSPAAAENTIATPVEEASASTMGEGGLTSDSEAAAERAKGSANTAENLLKPATTH